MLVEALLVLVVLTLGSSITREEKKLPGVTEVRFKAISESAQNPAQQPVEQTPDVRQPRPTQPQPDPPVDRPVPDIQPRPQPPQIIQLSRKEMSAMDISNLPRQPGPPAPARPMMGPPAPAGVSGDSKVVGTAPNGQPLYAAAWYREPYKDELDGYLSTATGPGWATIACRTVPDYRVDSCVKLDEYPTGSNIARAVLAAAWQFKVRPPRLGGKDLVGEWVRIRIEYGMRSRSTYGP